MTDGVVGHLARMPDTHMPKKMLFARLPKTRPASGLRRRWRDVIRHDLKSLNVSEMHWYGTALCRSS